MDATLNASTIRNTVQDYLHLLATNNALIYRVRENKISEKSRSMADSVLKTGQKQERLLAFDPITYADRGMR